MNDHSKARTSSTNRLQTLRQSSRFKVLLLQHPLPRQILSSQPSFFKNLSSDHPKTGNPRHCAGWPCTKACIWLACTSKDSPWPAGYRCSCLLLRVAAKHWSKCESVWSKPPTLHPDVDRHLAFVLTTFANASRGPGPRQSAPSIHVPDKSLCLRVRAHWQTVNFWPVFLSFGGFTKLGQSQLSCESDGSSSAKHRFTLKRELVFFEQFLFTDFSLALHWAEFLIKFSSLSLQAELFFFQQ